MGRITKRVMLALFHKSGLGKGGYVFRRLMKSDSSVRRHMSTSEASLRFYLDGFWCFGVGVFEVFWVTTEDVETMRSKLFDSHSHLILKYWPMYGPGKF